MTSFRYPCTALLEPFAGFNLISSTHGLVPHASAHTIQIRRHGFISAHNSGTLIHPKKNSPQR